MWLSSNSIHIDRFQWVEVARYVQSLDAVIREQTGPKKARDPVLISWDEVYEYSKKNSHTGVYTSIFHYDNKDLDQARRLGNLYFDFDDSAHPERAQQEAIRLVDYLCDKNIYPDALRVYFTGAKGFHVEAEAVALSIDPAHNLADIYRFIAESIAKELELTTLDTAVYDLRRMWRLPNTRHQKTGLYKTELFPDLFRGPFTDILDYARDRRPIEIPAQHFDRRSVMWYREWVAAYHAKIEEEQQKRIEMFNRLGTAVIGKPSDRYVKIVWEKALKALRESPEGDRNNTLFKQAFKLYMYAYANVLSHEHITNVLTEIGLGIGLTEREVTRTLQSADKVAATKEIDYARGKHS